MWLQHAAQSLVDSRPGSAQRLGPARPGSATPLQEPQRSSQAQRWGQG